MVNAGRVMFSIKRGTGSVRLAMCTRESGARLPLTVAVPVCALGLDGSGVNDTATPNSTLSRSVGLAASTSQTAIADPLYTVTGAKPFSLSGTGSYRPSPSGPVLTGCTRSVLEATVGLSGTNRPTPEGTFS